MPRTSILPSCIHIHAARSDTETLAIWQASTKESENHQASIPPRSSDNRGARLTRLFFNKMKKR